MSFTDQKPHTVTKKDLKLKWNGGKNGKYFRCYLCGHKFRIGDYYRWVYAGDLKNDKGLNAYMNFLVCENCDGDDIKERWKNHVDRGDIEYWWLKRR